MKSTSYLLALLCLSLTTAPALLADDAAPGDTPPAQAPADAAAPTVVDVPLDWAAGSHNVSHTATLKYTPGTRELSLAHLALADFSPLTGVDVRTGASFEEGVSHSGLKNHATAPAEWNLVVDVSGSSSGRERAIKAELQTVLNILSAIPEGDHIHLYALATDIEEWGCVTQPAARQALANTINDRLKHKNFGDKASFRKSSLIYSGLRKIISRSPEDARRRLIVLLSDGNDETSGNSGTASADRASALKQVAAEATGAGIPIHTLAFAQNSNERGGFPHLYNLSRETRGLNYAAALETFAFPAGVDVVRSLSLATHPHSSALTVQLREQSGDIRITLRGEKDASGYILITQASLAAATPAPEPEPAPQPEPPADSAEKTQLLALLDQLEPLHVKLEELKQGEAATPPAPADELLALADGIRELLPPALAKLNELKGGEQAKLREAVAGVTQDTELAEHKRGWAEKLLPLCEESHPNAVEEAELLTLLGRSEPLPLASEPTPEPQPETNELILPLSIGGGALVVLLIVVLLCVRSRKRRARQRELEAQQLAESRWQAEEPTQKADPNSGVTPVRPMLCELYCVKSEQLWEVHKPTATIGRDASNDIVISNTSVSAVHCILKLGRDGLWVLSDLGSANGIYHNNTTLTSLQLYNGCEFELGEVLLRFNDCRKPNV